MNVIRLMTLRQLRAEKTRTRLTLLEITIASGLLTAVLLGGLSLIQSIDPVLDLENGLTPLVFRAAALVSVLLLFSAAFLIRSAFAVSFSQRVRALGQLASVGATRRQLRASVYWEAALLGAAAIPAGMALSALGLFITFSVLNSFEAVVRLTGPLQLSVSVPGLLFCAAWCALMLFFAAHGPARAAFRVQPVESVSGFSFAARFPSFLSSSAHSSAWDLCRAKTQTRQTGRARMWKTKRPPEPQLARRSAAQDKARHRALCAGMAVSLALMMTAAGFSDGLRRAYAASAPAIDCRWHVWGDLDGTRPAETLEKAARLFPDVPSLQVELYSFLMEDRVTTGLLFQENLFVLEDEDFKAWYGALLMPENGVIPYVVSQGDSQRPEELVPSEYSLHGAAVLRQEGVCETPLPLGVGESFPFRNIGRYLAIVTNRTAFDAAFGTFPAVQREFSVYFGTNDAEPLMQPLYDLGKEIPSGDVLFQDYSATSEWAVRRTGILLLVSVFSWGFTVLVFLASAVSVVGTVSADLSLHRREYALLASAGMTQPQLHRMLRSQCLSYCTGLPFGLALGALFCITFADILHFSFESVFQIPVALLGSALLVGVCLLALALARKNLARLSIVDTLRGQA